MALVSLKYTGTAKYFETPITGSQQCWVPGQSSFVDSSYLAAFLATGNFVKFERDPVYEQDGALIDKDNTPLSTSGGVAGAILGMAASNPLRVGIRSFKNSWSNYGAGQTPVTVSVQPGGRVQYEGLIKPGVAFTNLQYMLELPVGFEPDLPTRNIGMVVDSGNGNIQRVVEFEMDGIATTNPALKVEVTGGTVPTSVALAQVQASGYSSALSAAIYWRNTTDSDDVAVLVPPAVLAPGATAKVAIWCHGAGDDYMSHISDGNAGFSSNLNRPVIRGLLLDGWIVVACTATSTLHWGNPNAWLAQKRAIDWIKSWLTIGKIAAVGQSMGGLMSLRALVEYPEIKNWYGIYPVADLQSAMGGSIPATIASTFAPFGGLAANLTACNPVSFGASKYAGKRLLCTASAADALVPKAGNADAIVAYAASGGASVASVTATTGDHGNASNFTAPIVTAMLAHLNG
jgi:pimeloyl-ACP methyl ester carboxylesterase